ncbi:MAG: hypothetical protein L6R38_001298 [Xanthoria sp. 2 TBL-2021]|nr:MAG: hypothetical protein L6R38_001298 [Xanthoria sp. 2 TBL-2021]
MPPSAASQDAIPSVYSIDSSQSSSSSSARPSIHLEPLPAWRTAKLLPYELREHCIIYFEESLYVPALHLLISLLISGTASTTPTPAFLPPPQQLALAATLAVHPSLTTRAQSEDRLQASNLALKYLRLVLDLVGPVNGNLWEAFAFSTVETSSRRGAKRRTTGDDPSPTKDDLDSINGELANAGSVWARAQDFWHVVGWAFSCSLLHPRRWERWQLWLQYMIDVLDSDWTLRAQMRIDDPANEQDPRERSMIVQYLNGGDTPARQERRILRAVFADGTSKSTGEFPEVWRNETKERKKDGDTKKPEAKLDIEADTWGLYMNDSSSSSDLEDTPPPASPPPAVLGTNPLTPFPDVSAPFGGPLSIVLRLRLLSLLSTVSVLLPHTFTPLLTLYDLYLEHIRPLSVPSFFTLISPSSMQYFHQSAASSITQIILRSLIASSAPPPLTDDLTQKDLERCYLPYPANTGSISDNAKVSLCVETLLRLLQGHCGLYWNDGHLQEAVEQGIEAREQKAKKAGKGRGKGKGDGEGERMWLRASAGRMRGLVDLVRGQEQRQDD